MISNEDEEEISLIALGFQGWDEVENELVSAHKGVTYLNLHCNSFTNLQEIPIAYLSNLRELVLSSNCFQTVDLPELILLPRLSTLDISGNSISSLEPLPFLPNIESFYISHNLITNLGGITNLPCLKLLDIRANRIAAVVDVLPIAGIDTLTDLLVANPDGSMANAAIFSSTEVVDLFNCVSSLERVNGQDRGAWTTESLTPVISTPKIDAILKRRDHLRTDVSIQAPVTAIEEAPSSVINETSKEEEGDGIGKTGRRDGRDEQTVVQRRVAARLLFCLLRRRDDRTVAKAFTALQRSCTASKACERQGMTAAALESLAVHSSVHMDEMRSALEQQRKSFESELCHMSEVVASEKEETRRVKEALLVSQIRSSSQLGKRLRLEHDKASKYKCAMNVLEEKMSALTKEMSARQSETDDRNEYVNQIERELEESRRSSEALRLENEHLQSLLEAKQQEVDVLCSEVSVSQVDRHSHAVLVASLHAKIEDLETQTEMVEVLTAKLATAVGDLKTRNDRILAVEGKLSTQIEVIAELERKVSEKASVEQELRSELLGEVAQLKLFKYQIEALERTIAAQQFNIDEKAADVEAKALRVSELQQVVGKLQHLVKAFKREKEELKRTTLGCHQSSASCQADLCCRGCQAAQDIVDLLVAEKAKIGARHLDEMAAMAGVAEELRTALKVKEAILEDQLDAIRGLEYKLTDRDESLLQLRSRGDELEDEVDYLRGELDALLEKLSSCRELEEHAKAVLKSEATTKLPQLIVSEAEPNFKEELEQKESMLREYQTKLSEVTAVLEKSRQEHENQLKQIMLAKDTELKQKCHDISSSYKQEKKRLKALVAVHEQDLRSTRDEMKRLQQSLAHQQRMLLAVTQSSFLLPDPSSVKE